MKFAWPLVVFGSAFILALALLYFGRAKAWYLHVLSLLVAVGLAAIPDPRAKLPLLSAWSENTSYLAIGFFCVLLGVWGLAAPFFRSRRAG